MKALPWIIAGVSLGLLVYVVANAPSTQYAGASDDVEDAANKTSAWGTKQRVTGTGGNLVGKLKEGAGSLTGDDQLQGEGLVDQAAGAVKDAAGQAAHAVSDTLHDLNK